MVTDEGTNVPVREDTGTTSSEDAAAAVDGEEPRNKKVRIDLDATKVQPIASSASRGGVTNASNSTCNARRSRPPPPASFAATLPSTGLDVLLIGRADLSRPLAESMLSLTFDRQRAAPNHTRQSGNNGKNKRQRRDVSSSVVKRGRGDPAIEALRRHLCRSSAADTTAGGGRGGGVASFGLADMVRARHIRLVESLSDLVDEIGEGDGKTSADDDSDASKKMKKPNGANTNAKSKADPRVDHAVIVLTPTDPFSSTRLRQVAASLHPDYAIQGRVTIVHAVGGIGDSGNDGPARAACPDLDRLLEDVERGAASKLSSMAKGGSTGSGSAGKMTLFAASVPVLRCNLKESHSRLAVARMILQRTKMGSRGCMGADDGLDVVASSKAGDTEGNDAEEEDGNISAGGSIGGIKGGISPLFFSSIL